MRITITTDDLSPAQFRWLQEHLPAERTFLAGEVRMCATFVTAAGDTLHREVGVQEWVRLVRELNLISLMLETQPPASVMWRQPRNAYERMQDLYGGYTADL